MSTISVELFFNKRKFMETYKFIDQNVWEASFSHHFLKPKCSVVCIAENVYLIHQTSFIGAGTLTETLSDAIHIS